MSRWDIRTCFVAVEQHRHLIEENTQMRLLLLHVEDSMNTVRRQKNVGHSDWFFESTLMALNQGTWFCSPLRQYTEG